MSKSFAVPAGMPTEWRERVTPGTVLLTLLITLGVWGRSISRLESRRGGQGDEEGGLDGTNLLGVRVVITESFERIHRSNLVGMGVLPLQFAEGVDRKTLKLDGSESFTIMKVADIRPRQDVEVTLTRADGTVETFLTRCRIDTVNELEYFLNGGILQYVLRKLAA